MSAVPNLPEDVLNIDSTNADAAVRQILETRSSEVKGAEHTNGIGRGTEWQLHDTPVENQRPIKVIVIGAGFSGLTAGVRCVPFFSLPPSPFALHYSPLSLSLTVTSNATSTATLTRPRAPQVPAEDPERRAHDLREERGRGRDVA